MSQEWKFIVVNVTYRDSQQDHIEFVSANYRQALSCRMRGDFETYLQQLVEDGWKLIRIQTINGGKDEAYYFRLSLV